ncbi:MAG TPA: ERAP1-like C-terminal domain-containing protein, partial [Nitrospirales bacterium]|nr:ERAP1-like C-terminal domain-containing protein [Nitrospirales bacterium]
FTYLPASGPPSRWHVPIRYRIRAADHTTVQRTLLTDAHARLPLASRADEVVVNESGHGFYRVRYAGVLRDRIEQALIDGRLSAIERFNLVSDAWAATVAGLTPLPDYLALTRRFRTERDHNVWAALIASFETLYRIVGGEERPALERFIRDRVGPVFAALGWEPSAGEDELTRQLRADVLRVLGTIGADDAIRRAALARVEQPAQVDANLWPAVIGILAHTGDAARYDQHVARARAATTPQEERRYLYSLAAFTDPALLERTIASAINGEIRTQDAPYLVRLVLLNVHGRERAWSFVTREWDTMARLYPKNGLRRMCDGIVGLATPELERQVGRFFAERKIDLGGKTLEQYLEQLRITVAFRERVRPTLARDLATA